MYLRNREPSLDELLDDPVTHAVMARDGLSAETIRALVAETRRRLHDRDGDAAPVSRTTAWLVRPVSQPS
jgi:hypothetical protein